jgi:hypothetical protein
MIIVGAGLAGLLAAKMLANHHPAIFEKQSRLPNNHSAVLRFRTPAIGQIIGMPFREVNMIKATMPFLNPVAAVLAYSRKNLGVALSDRSISGHSELVMEKRYIAPPNLIHRMADGLPITLGHDFNFRELSHSPIISTIPMPALMVMLDFPDRDKAKFGYVHGVNIRVRLLNCMAYVSLLVPDPAYAFSRVSITGDEMIVEIPGVSDMEPDLLDDYVNQAALFLGFDNSHFACSPTIHRQPYAKIAPIDEDIRRDFIFWATDKHNVYSLGRFATWRPKLLLDDLVQDVRKIEHWITRNDRYARAAAR